MNIFPVLYGFKGIENEGIFCHSILNHCESNPHSYTQFDII